MNNTEEAFLRKLHIWMEQRIRYLEMGVVYVVVSIAIGICYAIHTGDLQTAIDMIRQY